MAIDLALGGTDRPQTRSRRSQGARIDAPSPTVASRDFARVSSVEGAGPGARQGGNTALGELAGAVAGFFPDLIKQEKARDLDPKLRENAEEIARIETQVMSDRAGARQAVLDGDFSKFIPDSDMRRRQVISDTFQSITARVMAYEDFESELKDAISSTPTDGNPDDVVEEFLRNKTEGAGAIFGQEYTRSILKSSGKTIAEFRKSRLELQQQRAETRGTELVTSAMKAGHVPPGQEGIATLRRSLIGSLPMNSPEAVMRANAILDDALISMAAAGNAQAMSMVHLREDARDGTSVALRNKGAVAKLTQAHIAARDKVKSVEAATNLGNIDNRLAAVKAGLPGSEEDSVERLLADVYRHQERYGGAVKGDSAKWRTVRDKVLKELDGKAVFAAANARVALGQSPRLSNADYDDWAEATFAGRNTAAIAQNMGGDVEAANTQATRVLATMGSGKKLMQTNSRVLLSGDGQAVKETYARLKTLRLGSKRPMADLHLTQDAADMFALMFHSEEAGRDFLVDRNQYLDAIKDGAEPRNHFAGRQVNPNNPDDGVQGPMGRADQARRAWKSWDKQELKVAGWRWTGGAMPTYDDVSPNVRRLLESSIDRASLMLSGRPASMEDIRTLALKMVEGSFGVEITGDGKPNLTIDNTPPVAISPEGVYVPGAKMTMAAVDRAKKALVDEPDAVTQSLFGLIGDFGGAQMDAQTRAGRGLGVVSTVNGFASKIAFGAGSTINVPIHEGMDPKLGIFFQEVGRDEASDTMTLRAPQAPPAGSEHAQIQLNDNLFFMYDKDTQGWHLRYADAGANIKDIRGLSEANKASRRSLEDRAPTAASRTRATEQKVGPLPADLPPSDPTEDYLNRRNELRTPEEAPVGSPAPIDDTAPGGPSEDTEKGFFDRIIDDVLDTFSSLGIISSPAAAATMDEARAAEAEGRPYTPEMATRRAFMNERARGGHLNDLTEPQSKRFLNETASFLEESEGRRADVYSDHTKKRWTRGAEGDPTVGIGFNMTRSDARELIKKVGGDYDKLMAGTTHLSEGQQDHLLALTVQKTVNWLRKRFDGTDLKNHQWMALISLAYNSRWNENGPTLIGPKLTAAVKAGDNQAVFSEIVSNSMGGVPPKLWDSIQARRWREGSMYLGVID